VGIVTWLALEKIDSKFGATRTLVLAYENMGMKLREIEWEINRDMNYLERTPHLIPCLFGPYAGIIGC
jgi:hypothetical protein